MSSVAASNASRDVKVYPVCSPWFGKAGAEFERTFEPDFLANVGSHIKDKYSNAAKHLTGKDPGGVTPPTAAALALNANAPGTLVDHRGSVAAGAAAAARETYADSVAAFNQRDEDILAALRQHIPVPSIQNMIDQMKAAVEADLPTAIQLGTRDANGVTILPPVYSPGHPNAGNALAGADLTAFQANGNSLSRHVWAAIRTRGVKAPSGIKTLTQQASWTTLGMEAVGYDELSCTNLKLMIETLDRESGNIRSNEDKRIKFLSVVHASNSCAEIRSVCANELLSASLQCRVGNVFAGNPDFDLYTDIELATGESDRTKRPYLSALASALYAVVMVHGECAYHVAYLSRFSKDPSDKAMNAVVMLLQYLWCTRSLKIVYRSGNLEMPNITTATPPLNYAVFSKMDGLLIFSDAAWKTDYTYGGFVVLMAGAAIDWNSSLFKVKLSSSEAEIAAGSRGGKRSAYIRNFIGEVYGLPSLPIQHVIDNNAMPALTENVGVSKKTEHFARWMQYLRHLVTHGYMYIHLARTWEMIADPFTKVTGKDIFLMTRNAFYGKQL